MVLRCSGTDAYNEWIMELSINASTPLNSVTTILFNNKKASADPVVLAAIANAEAIFLAGGDQSVYVDYWMNSPVQNALQDKLATVTIGGTSAGCMVLSNWIYSASKGSIVSSEALANPYDRYETIVPAFLLVPFLDTIIADSHFGS